MTAAVAVIVVGLIGVVTTEFNAALEMWTPLILALTPLLAYMLWPRRDQSANRPAPRRVP